MENESTLFLIKPDVTKRGLEERLENYLKTKLADAIITKRIKIEPCRELIEAHYAEHKDKLFFPWIVDEMLSGDIVVIIIKGKDIIQRVRKLNGDTDPAKAQKGTIRNKFAEIGESVQKSDAEKRSIRNCVHASDSKESANREIKIWSKYMKSKKVITV